jgi:hypothetical protein
MVFWRRLVIPAELVRAQPLQILLEKEQTTSMRRMREAQHVQALKVYLERTVP